MKFLIGRKKIDEIEILPLGLQMRTSNYKRPFGFKNREDTPNWILTDDEVYSHNDIEKSKNKMLCYSVANLSDIYVSNKYLDFLYNRIVRTAEYMMFLLKTYRDFLDEFYYIKDEISQFERDFKDNYLRQFKKDVRGHSMDEILVNASVFQFGIKKYTEFLVNIRRKMGDLFTKRNSCQRDYEIIYKNFTDFWNAAMGNPSLISNSAKYEYQMFFFLLHTFKRLKYNYLDAPISDNFIETVKTLYPEFEPKKTYSDETEFIQLLEYPENIDCFKTLYERLTSEAGVALSIIKEEFSDYMTNAIFLNNPISKTLFVITNDKYNALDFWYNGVDRSERTGLDFYTEHKKREEQGNLLNELVNSFEKLIEKANAEKRKLDGRKERIRAILNTPNGFFIDPVLASLELLDLSPTEDAEKRNIKTLRESYILSNTDGEILNLEKMIELYEAMARSELFLKKNRKKECFFTSNLKEIRKYIQNPEYREKISEIMSDNLFSKLNNSYDSDSKIEFAWIIIRTLEIFYYHKEISLEIEIPAKEFSTFFSFHGEFPKKDTSDMFRKNKNMIIKKRDEYNSKFDAKYKDFLMR